ncbi:uncharacterized protein [Coffea arabica]|uniref:DEAD-box ATP-dependent RNA helicase 48 n=1 Tax=Coffea arabica TaxID=13443 RepID=A0A6P6SU14_COFAR|nr:uncharacterized protein LOC113694821 [Coffea arabica]XP_027069509.1 uncharacterized protein LOC113694821 [Coffea arabica]XP_027069510.1 uncharacterized protein LOC113694821 [Coffea arabica]XP_027069511.1 uncharacterized protein LOC113694821 [Coffea arabica]
MATLCTSLSNQAPPPNFHLSSLGTISGRTHVQFLPAATLTTRLSLLSLTTTRHPFRTTTIRMGGGPRTYPGGVSKWQWKRMQAKKAKQLLKARLARERQIYEMRKRAELKAAVSELERPWEVVEKPPTLFSVTADEQLKVLADRFQKPGGFDMWSDRDGPELFKSHDGLPSSRFFPKGVVHSVKPYGKIENLDDMSDDELWGGNSDFDLGRGSADEGDHETALLEHGINGKHAKKRRNGANGEKNLNNLSNEGYSGKNWRSKLGKNHNGNVNFGDSTKVGQVRGGSWTDRGMSSNCKDSRRRPNGREKVKDSESAVFDLSMQKDGIYGIQQENRP